MKAIYRFVARAVMHFMPSPEALPNQAVPIQPTIKSKPIMKNTRHFVKSPMAAAKTSASADRLVAVYCDPAIQSAAGGVLRAQTLLADVCGFREKISAAIGLARAIGDVPTTEAVARVLASQLRAIEVAIDEIRLISPESDSPDEQVAAWRARIAVIQPMLAALRDFQSNPLHDAAPLVGVGFADLIAQRDGAAEFAHEVAA